MLKNLTLARVVGLTSSGDLGAAARCSEFVPCGPTQAVSVGFVPPREANGAMCESVAGHWILAARIQTKAVPPAAIKKWVDSAAAAVERETGRKPGRKQRKDLAEEALLALLPNAFPKDTTVVLWVDPERGLLALDNVSPAKTDVVFSLIAQALKLTTLPVLVPRSPGGWMGEVLASGEGDGPFTVGRDVEMYSPDGGAAVRYTDQDLSDVNVRHHVYTGKRVRRLALEWTNGAVGYFVLAEDLTLRKITLGVPPTEGESAADSFDADVAISAGTLRVLIDDLLALLDPKEGSE